MFLHQLKRFGKILLIPFVLLVALIGTIAEWIAATCEWILIWIIKNTQNRHENR